MRFRASKGAFKKVGGQRYQLIAIPEDERTAVTVTFELSDMDAFFANRVQAKQCRRLVECVRRSAERRAAPDADAESKEAPDIVAPPLETRRDFAPPSWRAEREQRRGVRHSKRDVRIGGSLRPAK